MAGLPISKRTPTSRSARIAVTLGDPAGIGPEVTLKALVRLPASLRSRLVLLGPADFYARLAKKLRIALSFQCVADAAMPAKKGIACFPTDNLPATIHYGASQDALTRAAVRSIELAVELALLGDVSAIVTAPINKAGLKKAGFKMPGHTEYLAELSNTKHYDMMLVGGNLRVVVVTRHVPIKDVATKLNQKRIESAILTTDRELRESFGIARPKIVVCGLNPHAGEKGTIGTEEIRIIAPAVRRAARKIKGTLVGPLSPDSLFHDAYAGKYDAEICMYHDQGLIPLKMISRGHGVNVTLGLPFVRTSPDHGTGYDITSRFVADPGSMVAALKLADTLSRNRRRA